MKKRLAAFIMTAAIFLTLMGSGTAAADVQFISVNDSLLELSNGMPATYNGVLYVPAAVFNSSYNLGITYSHILTNRIIILYNSRITLTFSLEAGNAYDSNGNTYAVGAISRGGTYYFPLATVSAVFGLSYYQLPNNIAPLLRIKSSSAALSDAVFLDAAEDLMQKRYNEYIASLPEDEPDPPPSVPDNGPETNTPDDGNTEDDNVSAVLYLTFWGEPGEHTDEILSILKEKNVYGTFFISPEDMNVNVEKMRAMVVSGNNIGIDAASLEEIESIGDSLDRVGYVYSQLISQDAQDAQDAGYVLCGWDIDCTELSAYQLNNQMSVSGEYVLKLPNSEATAERLEALLRSLMSEDCRFEVLDDISAIRMS